MMNNQIETKRRTLKYSIGKKFGRLTIISLNEQKEKNGSLKYDCLCDCGALRVIRGRSLLIGRTLSCGCYNINRSTIHGSYMTTEYFTWRSMKSRCLSPKGTGYKNYGGRGIKICQEWMDFNNFLKDMGRKPDSSYSLDRIDNNGNYEPSNCRWATPKEQGINTRKTTRNLSRNFLIWKAYNTQTLLQLTKIFNLSESTILYALKKYRV